MKVSNGSQAHVSWQESVIRMLTTDFLFCLLFQVFSLPFSKIVSPGWDGMAPTSLHAGVSTNHQELLDRKGLPSLASHF